MEIKMEAVPGKFAICKIKTQLSIPYWATSSSLLSVTRYQDEFSIVAEENVVPPNVESNGGWSAMRVQGVLDFSQVGILAAITKKLADAEISVFAVSTFNTDYILVKSENFEKALQILS